MADPRDRSEPGKPRLRRSRLFEAEPDRFLVDEWAPAIVLPPPPSVRLPPTPNEEPIAAVLENDSDLEGLGLEPADARSSPARIYVGIGKPVPESARAPSVTLRTTPPVLRGLPPPVPHSEPPPVRLVNRPLPSVDRTSSPSSAPVVRPRQPVAVEPQRPPVSAGTPAAPAQTPSPRPAPVVAPPSTPRPQAPRPQPVPRATEPTPRPTSPRPAAAVPIQLSAPNAPTLARPTPISKVPARFSPGAIAPSSEPVSPLVPVPPKPAAPKPAARAPSPAQPARPLEPRSNLLIALLLLILVVSVWLVVRLGVPLFEELRHGRQEGATRTAEPSTNVAPEASSPGKAEKAPSKPATTAPVDAVSGVLRVESDLPATAQVDGKPIGPTPIRELVLPQGAHRVEVVFSDGRTQVANTQITAGRATAIRFTVKKPE